MANKPYSVQARWVDGTKEAADFESFHSATRFFKGFVADFAVERVVILRNGENIRGIEVIAVWNNQTT